MIVTDLPDGDWHLFRQADHARTSGQIARAWRRPTFLDQPLWDMFILAVSHHDDGWDAADDQPLLDAAGRPLNFKTYPTAQHVVIWQRTLQGVAALGGYPQLLVAAHARWLYTQLPTPREGSEAAAVAFVAQLDAMIDALLRRLATQPAYAQAVAPSNFDLSRKLFSFFDALSLVFVRGLGWMSFTEELPVGSDVQKMKIHGEMCAIRWGRMTPWPFVEDDVTFSIPLKRIAGRAYGDAQSLLDTLGQTPPAMRYYNLGRL